MKNKNKIFISERKKLCFILFCLILGIFLLVQVLMPLISYKYWELFVYRQNLSLLSPESKSGVLGVSIQNKGIFPSFVSSTIRDHPSSYNQFTLSIPTLKITQAKVLVDSQDFDTHLAHLPGSALPGEQGNIFITGHSSLPFLFRSDNYKAIFANLTDIKKGDEIILDTGGQVFTYIVDGLIIVKPKDTWVVEPVDNQGRYLTLMTCVPPGLYLKRLIVLAILKQ